MVITLPELRQLWARLAVLEGVTGASLRLCVLLGGQRPTQLFRLKAADVDLHAGWVTLYDTKGRRNQPRTHSLPLSERAQAELKPWLGLHPDGYVLSSTGGRVPMREESLSNAFRAIAKAMREAGEISKPIRLADIRRSVETLLAGSGISMEVRAQLQSHGLGGVQNRHYDRHSYQDEKRHALRVLERLVLDSETTGQVIELASARR